MLTELPHKSSFISTILAILLVLNGVCGCILAQSSCYLKSTQEICLDEQTNSQETCLDEQLNDKQCTATTQSEEHEEHDKDCCPVQCLLKNTNDLAEEILPISFSDHINSLIVSGYTQTFISTPSFYTKITYRKARSPSPLFNLHSQNSILRI